MVEEDGYGDGIWGDRVSLRCSLALRQRTRILGMRVPWLVSRRWRNLVFSSSMICMYDMVRLDSIGDGTTTPQLVTGTSNGDSEPQNLSHQLVHLERTSQFRSAEFGIWITNAIPH